MDKRFLVLILAAVLGSSFPAARSDAATPANSPESGQANAESHAQERAFRQVKEAFAGARYGWVFLPRSRVLSSLKMPLQSAANIEQPLLRFLAVEMAESFTELSFVAFALDEKNGELELTVALPEDADLLVDALSFSSALTARGQIGAPWTPPGTLLSISAHADPQAIELLIRRLTDQRLTGLLSTSASELDPLVQGLAAALPLLGNIQPDVHLVIARQSFSAEGVTVPSLRMPSVALIVRPKDPQQARPLFTAAYLAAMMQANEIARKGRRPRLKMKSWKRNEAFFAGSRFRPLKDSEDINPRTRAENALLYNISPAIGIVGDQYIVSSGQELAEDLVRLMVERGPTKRTKGNARIAVGPLAMAHLLIDNAPWFAQHRGPRAEADLRKIEPLLRSTGHLLGFARAVELPCVLPVVPMNVRVMTVGHLDNENPE